MNAEVCNLMGAGVTSVLIGRQCLNTLCLVVEMSAGILTWEAS